LRPEEAPSRLDTGPTMRNGFEVRTLPLALTRRITGEMSWNFMRARSLNRFQSCEI